MFQLWGKYSNNTG